MTNKKTSRRKHSVVILTSVITEGLREMLQGVLNYSHEIGHWRIYLHEDRRWAYHFKDWEKWGCSGIVAADHHSLAEAKRIRESGLPAVVLLQPREMRDPGYPLHGFPCCVFNSTAIGRMAAAYFLARRYRSFAFVGDVHADTYWSVERERGFRERLAEDGIGEVRAYTVGSAAMRDDWMTERPGMVAWLKSLPPGTAIFAANDRRGKQVLDACDFARIHVPQKLAVLGVDDDAYICESSVPTLSSVKCQVFDAGWRIAAHLEALMSGAPTRGREYSVEPLRVVTRQSTDWMAVADEKVIKMLLQIDRDAGNPRLSVDKVARHAGVSRRAAEIRFKNVTGTTIHGEIERKRLELIREHLQDRRLPMSEVAARSGFVSVAHMDRLFRLRTGTTPSAARRR